MALRNILAGTALAVGLAAAPAAAAPFTNGGFETGPAIEFRDFM